MSDTFGRRFWTDVREMVAELVQYRELLYQMTMRDLLLRYKQTAMGFGWAVLMPLLNTAVFSVVFTRVAPIETPVPYPVFVYCGLLGWNFFAASLRFSINSLTANTNLVAKIYFPREIFPFSAMIVCFIDTLVATIVLIALMIFYRIGVGPALVFLPLVVLVQVLFTAALALLLSMSNLFFRDVKYLFEVILTVWMFLTPVLYPVDRLGGRLERIMRLNPMTQIIDAYRSVILLQQPPDLVGFGSAGLVCLALLTVSWRTFHRTERRFAENI
jgi:ABC-type polysaccharide/polyol phosphate export permease